jgi:hypothetical protein
MLPRYPINLNRQDLWQQDVAASVAQYNTWFMKFAPAAFRAKREHVAEEIEHMLIHTSDLQNLTPAALLTYPKAIAALRMSTAPPIARDRLVGLARVSKLLVENMELAHRLPPKMPLAKAEEELGRIGQLILSMADEAIFPWLERQQSPTQAERERAATIIADRLCGAIVDPIVRNAQEVRQLAEIKAWLEARGYRDITDTRPKNMTLHSMPNGTFAFRMQVKGKREDGNTVNIPVDTVIKRLSAVPEELPIFLEAKSAGDFTNTNKRRKEEAVKHTQLREAHGPTVEFVLFLCGYFDTAYLEYEAAAGIDWVWEHRLDDFSLLNL